MFHLLELSMLGVFMALDYVLFYVFWEISLVPMYLLIGIWGGKNRQLRLDQVLYLHLGRLGRHAVGDLGDLLCHRHL